MSKHRIYEIAKEYNTSSKVVIDILARNNIAAKNHMSSVDEIARGVIERTFARKTETQARMEKPAVQRIQPKDAKAEQTPNKDRQENKEQDPRTSEKADAPRQQLGQAQTVSNIPKDQRQYQQRPQSSQQQQAAGAQGQQHRQPRQDGQEQQYRPHRQGGGQGQQYNQQRPGEQSQQQRPPRQDGQNQQERPPRQDGQNQQQRPPRQDGQNQQQRPPRQDGQNQQQRPPRQDGQGQQQRPPRQDGQGQQQRPPRQDGQNQQQRPPRQDGQNQQQRPPRQDGQNQQQRPPRQDGQGQQQRPLQQNNRYWQDGRNESTPSGQQGANQANRQQASTQSGQQRSGFAPQPGRQQRPAGPAAQQRSFGSNERRNVAPGQANTGQNQKQFTNDAKNQYAGQGRQQPPRGAQPDWRGQDGNRLNQPSSGNNRPFAPRKPDFAGAQAAVPKQTASSSGQRAAHKGKDRQVHQNPKGVSTKSDREIENLRKNRQQPRTQRNASAQTQNKQEMPKPKTIKLGGAITVKDLSGKIAREVSEVIKKLMGLGIMATINQEIDFDTASLIAGEFGVTVEELPPEEDPTEIPEIEDDVKDLIYRSPVVTVMGHVDHGKTSLLDSIRQTNVIAQEAGGITQHIGAYQVMCQDKKIVFLDTPGHEAFTAMRARGAQITDIAILVVAADDGVMPQTLEAINHAKSAKVPIIVAINKIDRPGANPDRVKQQLSENGLIPEDWGGDTVMVPVSAYQRTGINELLEMILLVAEMLELKANPNRKAYGTIIEAKLDKGRGPVSTILVQKGTLKIGDPIIAGAVFGKVRAMTNDRGEKVKKAEPSTPVEVLGLADVPLAGDIMVAVDEKTARAVSEKRAVKKRSEELKQSHKVSLDDLFKQIQEGSLKDLNIVVKADVQGSIEALAQSLASLKNKEVRVNIIHAGVGAINESDVMLATASNALIIGFNVRPDTNARRVADNEKVDIRTYRVIYEAINDVEAAITGMLAPEFKEVIYGRLEIRQIINIPKGVVAGSYVLEGKVTSTSQVRLIRDGIVIYEGRIESLRRFKDDVKEVSQGYECGVTIEKYRDIKEGDILESFGLEQVAQKTG